MAGLSAARLGASMYQTASQFASQVMQELISNIEAEHRKRMETIDILRQVVRGELDASRVRVSDDGAEVMPEIPEMPGAA